MLRVGLYGIKPWFVRRLRRAEDALVARRVSPDALTVAGVAASLAAGAAIALGGRLELPLLWLAVPPLVVVRLALNALDGSLARRTRKARPLGTVLNEAADRVGDAATIGATGLVVSPALALGAVAGSFLASITGVLSLALTGRRDSGGPMGKADRAAVLGMGAAAGAIAGSALPFVVVLWAIAGGSLVTAAVRLARLRRELSARARPRVADLLATNLVELPSESLIEEEMLDAVHR